MQLTTVSTPGSPLAGYDQELGRLKQLLDANDVTFVPGLNEEAAATSIQGSQLACTLPGATRDGVLGIWYGKAPGLDRATDALRRMSPPPGCCTPRSASSSAGWSSGSAWPRSTPASTS